MAKDTYILVRRGHVQRADTETNGNKCKVWPVAQTYDDAKKLIQWFGLWDGGVRPSRLGEVQGETLAGHITMAVDEGCEGSCCVVGWEANG